MTITFSPQLRPIGFRLGCAFETAVFTDYARPPQHHPVSGGCSRARQYVAAREAYGCDVADQLVPLPADAPFDFQDWCTDWNGTIRVSEAFVPGPELNVANRNGVYLMELLGVDPDCYYCGSLPAEDFLGRVLVAQGMSLGDPGRPPITTQNPGHATVIDCGRPEGYADERLVVLAEIAEAARDAGVVVQWS